MGGDGSSRWDGHIGKPLTEQYLTVDINALRRSGQIEDNAEQVTALARIEWTRCNYGGARPWFLCPLCGSRVGRLYLVAGIVGCRQCRGLVYRVQNETLAYRLARKVKGYQKRVYDRHTPEMQAFLRPLLSPPPMLPRPKGMHFFTYLQYTVQKRLTEDAAYRALFGAKVIREWFPDKTRP